MRQLACLLRCFSSPTASGLQPPAELALAAPARARGSASDARASHGRAATAAAAAPQQQHAARLKGALAQVQGHDGDGQPLLQSQAQRWKPWQKLWLQQPHATPPAAAPHSTALTAAAAAARGDAAKEPWRAREGLDGADADADPDAAAAAEQRSSYGSHGEHGQGEWRAGGDDRAYDGLLLALQARMLACAQEQLYHLPADDVCMLLLDVALADLAGGCGARPSGPSRPGQA